MSILIFFSMKYFRYTESRVNIEYSGFSCRRACENSEYE